MTVWVAWEGTELTATKDKKSTQSFEVFYQGTDDVNTAASAINSYLTSTVPDLFSASGFLELQRIGSVKRIAEGYFTATATYGDPERNMPNNTALGEFKIAWDISSVSQKQTFSKSGSFTAYVDPAFNDPNPDGAIGIKKSNNGKITIEGVERRYPAMKFSINLRVGRGSITGAYTRNLRDKMFYRNSATWLGYAAKELLFVGSSGSQSVFGDPEIKFDFETDVETTISGLGAIPTITKPPHDYVDIVYDTQADDTNKQMISKPIAAYVHEFYPTTNFATLFGFGP